MSDPESSFDPAAIVTKGHGLSDIIANFLSLDSNPCQDGLPRRWRCCFLGNSYAHLAMKGLSDVLFGIPD